MTKVVKYGNTSIDSFKLRIPYEQCYIIDTALELHYVKLDISTGEPFSGEEFKDLALFKESQNKSGYKTGIKTRYAIEYVESKEGRKKYVTILINSKMLERNYLDGISNNNIKDVYSYLMNHKVISVQFEDFINGFVTDIDFKLDFLANQYEYRNIIDYAKLRTKATKQASSGYKQSGRYNSKNGNYGIQWGQSRNQATEGRPFVKIYWKAKELENKSTNFYNTYLKQCPPDLRRIEYTLKNKKHIHSTLGIDENKLSNILQQSPEQFKQGLILSLNKHFHTYQVSTKTFELNGKDLIIVRMLDLLMKNTALTFSEILEVIYLDLKGKANEDVKKSRIKALMDKLWLEYQKDYIGDLEKLKIDSMTKGERFFKALGMN